MRLDKYLKIARLSKRRAIAKQLAEEQRVYVNDKLAKPSTEIKIGDYIKIVYGKRIITVQVKLIVKQISKQDSNQLYEIVKEELIEDNH